MRKLILILLLLVPMAASAASPARFDLPILTTTPAQVPVGSLPNLLGVTNATVAVCGYPATLVAGMCTNTVSTYPDATLGTPCPPTAQLTAPGTSVCISTTGIQGSLGFWYDAAQQTHMTYTVKTKWGTFGPYDILAGGGSGSYLPLSGGTLTGDTSISAVGSATSSANVNSPNMNFIGHYWNGTASAVDTWNCSNNLSIWTGSPANPVSNLDCEHSGSSGGGVFKVPALSAADITSVNIRSFGQPTGHVMGVAAMNPATSSANFSSPYFDIAGSFWNGSVGNISELFSFQDVIPTTGTNPNVVLALTHTGSSGTTTFDTSGLTTTKVSNLDVTGTCTGCGAGSGFITSLTTTGTSGPSTVTSGVLNVPQYAGGSSLPTATAAGQAPVSTAAGSTYAAQQIMPLGFGYTFYIDGSGNTNARNNQTGAVDYSNADAGIVIRSAINNIASTCGHLYFQPGIYNINSLVAETAAGFTATWYGIGIPGNAGTNQFCQWFIEGDSAPDLRDEFGDPTQTKGVVLNVTSTALSAVTGTPMADVIWVRPESGGSGVSGSLWVKNIDVRFPNNQRGNETGIDATQASNVNYENAMADTAVAGGSLAFPVAGSLGMYGLTSTNSVHEENYIKSSYAIGYDTSFDIQSEHTILVNSFGLNANYCVNYGVRGSTINHASTFVGGGCGEAIHGLTLGANMAPHTQFEWRGFDMEDLSSGIWQPVVYHVKETNVNGSYGKITYSRDLQGTQTVLSSLFDGGGGGGFTVQDQNKTYIQSVAVTAAGAGGAPTTQVTDNEPATTGGTFPADFLVPNLPAGGFTEVRFGQSTTNGNAFNWGFWNVGAADPCNQGFFGVYGSNFPLTITYGNKVGINVGLGTCPTDTLQDVGSFSAGSARQFQVNAAGAVTTPSLNGLTTPTAAGQAKIAQLINNGTLALPSGTAIAAGACQTTTVASASVLTTDKLTIQFQGDPTSTTGYIPGAMLTVIPYLTAGNINVKDCNNTASSITPAAFNVQWWAERF